MEELFLALGSAFWLGILTTISPCPLATNVAAVSFVARRVDAPGKALAAGILYTLGRALAYAGIAMVLVSSLLSTPAVAHWLQKYTNQVLGPVLILVALILLEVIPITFGGMGVSAEMQERVERLGVWGGGLLGLLFALSFCPTSAALYFGSLLPLAIQQQSSILVPAVYGLATGLPVLIFAILIAVSANRMAKAFDRVTAFEKWARRITAVVFLLVGLHYCLVYYAGISVI